MPSCMEGKFPDVWLKITIGGEPQGKLIIKLFYDIVPRTAENFRFFCEQKGMRDRYSYRGTKFTRVVPGFICQGGDFARLTPFGSKSKYGYRFEDENFEVKHDRPGILSMANSGRNRNGCQFFILWDKVEWLDGKHVAFGIVKEGMDLVRKMFSLGGPSGKPSKEILIKSCGEVLDEEGEAKKIAFIQWDIKNEERRKREQEMIQFERRKQREAEEKALTMMKYKRDREAAELAEAQKAAKEAEAQKAAKEAETAAKNAGEQVSAEGAAQSEEQASVSKDGVTEGDTSAIKEEADLVVKEGEVSAAKEGEASAAKEEEVSAVKEGEVSAAKEGEVSAGKEGDVSAAKEGEDSAANEGEVSAAKEGEVSAVKEGEVSAGKEGEDSAAKEGEEPTGPNTSESESSCDKPDGGEPQAS